MVEEITSETVNKWWHVIRPWWHLLTFIVIMTFLIATNWSKVSAYEGRISSLEVWKEESSKQQAQQGQDIAVMKQQVGDIHDYLIPKTR